MYGAKVSSNYVPVLCSVKPIPLTYLTHQPSAPGTSVVGGMGKLINSECDCTQWWAELEFMWGERAREYIPLDNGEDRKKKKSCECHNWRQGKRHNKTLV